MEPKKNRTNSRLLTVLEAQQLFAFPIGRPFLDVRAVPSLEAQIGAAKSDRKFSGVETLHPGKLKAGTEKWWLGKCHSFPIG